MRIYPDGLVFTRALALSGLKQRDIIARTGLSHDAVSRVFRGLPASPQTIFAIADVLNLRHEDVISKVAITRRGRRHKGVKQ